MSIKQRIVQVLPASLKQKLKTISFELLCATDDTFRFNNASVASTASDVGGAKLAEISSKKIPTFVFNEGGYLANSAMLEIVINSIWPNQFGTWKNELINLLWEQPARRINHDEVVKFVRQYLEGLLKSSEVLTERTLYLELLSALATHEVASAKSKAAYSTEGGRASSVFWPDPTHARAGKSIFETLPENDTPKIISKSTPVGSAGSCFAVEIAKRLQTDGFNYVVTEKDESKPVAESCAQWGIIFNTPSFRQLIQRSFGGLQLPKLLWSIHQNGQQYLSDPFREGVLFKSVEEYENSYESHQIATREALLKTEVFVLTLGMNEVWRLKATGDILSRAPWHLASELVEPFTMTVEENLNELQTMLDLWRLYNPNIKIILSVSPVPLHATFRHQEMHIISANAHSKATLRVVADEFARKNSGVYYFPSYETVMHCTENAWDADQRHVAPHAVDNVMRLFHRMFVASE